MIEPLDSVIIPLYNGEKVIEACLDSVLASDYRRFEVLVIDDASKDASVDKVRPYIRAGISLFRNRKNLGFGRTVNTGWQKAKGSILVLLNMDTVIEKDFLPELVKALMSGTDIGIAGSKIFYMDGRTIQHAGGVLDNIARSYHIGRGEDDKGQYDFPKEAEYVCGAAVGIKREVMEKTGGFDEGFRPLYYEEIDLMKRARKAGYRVLYAPGCRSRHSENYSAGQKGRVFYYASRNRIRFVLKNFTVRRILGEFLFDELRFFLSLEKDKKAQLFSAYVYNMARLAGIIVSRV